MYELLTGRPPFTGDSPVAIAYQHVRENPVPPSRVDPSLPPWADSIVLKAMAKSPNDRYQSAAEMLADIQRAASGMQVAAAMPPTRAEYYDYQQRTAQMGPQTMMGSAPTTMTPYNTGYQTGYQQPYGYGSGNGRQQGGGARRWLPWVISGLVVLAAIIVAVILMNGGGGNSAFVPQVDGMTWPQAESLIKNAGLVPVEHKEPSSGVPSGQVISTNPDNGNSAPKGSTVTVNVSSGVANIALPNLQGAQATAAEAQLKSLGFTSVTPAPDPQSTQPAGTVDHMTPAPGNYPPGQQITLYVSGGGVPVPSVVGQTAAEAQSILQQDGFTVQTNSTPAPADANAQPGTVYNQNPAANAVEPKGTLIQIFVQPQTTDTGSPTDTASPTDTGSPTGTGSPTATTTPSPGATPTGP
jgi:serine/threonine-protein kinase